MTDPTPTARDPARPTTFVGDAHGPGESAAPTATGGGEQTHSGGPAPGAVADALRQVTRYLETQEISLQDRLHTLIADILPEPGAVDRLLVAVRHHLSAPASREKRAALAVATVLKEGAAPLAEAISGVVQAAAPEVSDEGLKVLLSAVTALAWACPLHPRLPDAFREVAARMQHRQTADGGGRGVILRKAYEHVLTVKQNDLIKMRNVSELFGLAPNPLTDYPSDPATPYLATVRELTQLSEDGPPLSTRCGKLIEATQRYVAAQFRAFLASLEGKDFETYDECYKQVVEVREFARLAHQDLYYQIAGREKRVILHASTSPRVIRPRLHVLLARVTPKKTVYSGTKWPVIIAKDRE